ncbi:MAG: helicase RepA family protein [Pirellula sp.]|jgi:RecA-family ATPase|nr:helicase RepA family protein [Pirellula sp.]
MITDPSEEIYSDIEYEAKQDELKKLGHGWLVPKSIRELALEYPKDDPILIDGLLRVGETMNVIAPPKAGKSWMVAMLVFCLVNGLKWLGYQCTKSRVLLFDCELKPSTLRYRLETVAYRMGVDTDGVDVVSLRGRNSSINELATEIKASIEPGKYQAICFDALYRLLPDGVSENDNAKMMAIYNKLDEIAHHTQASNIVIHHASKGNQAGKHVTDVGAGAGSVSRAADTHMVIREHESESIAVVDTVCRSFISPERRSIRWQWPLWYLDDAEPVLKGTKPEPTKKKAKSSNPFEEDF